MDKVTYSDKIAIIYLNSERREIDAGKLNKLIVV
jgi:hypothetical protein